MRVFAYFFTTVLAMEMPIDDECNAKKKAGFCTDVTHHTTWVNSWVCKNCFNLRVEFNLGWIGPVGKYFDNTDHIYFAFNQPVSFIKQAGPATPIEMMGKYNGLYIFKMGFINNFKPGDGRIDINVEFNDNGGDRDGDLEFVKLCPCGLGYKEEDGCDASKMDGGIGGFWHCGYWHRAGPKELRMAKCYYMCHGDPKNPLIEKDNWFTAAKSRCFREQGKLWRPKARTLGKEPRAKRELNKWELGRTSGDKLDCTSGKGLKMKFKVPPFLPKTGGNKGGGYKPSRK